MPILRKKSQFLEFALLFALIYLGMQFGLRMFFPQYFDKGSPREGFFLEAMDSTVKGGHHPILKFQNLSQLDLTFKDRCPMPPVDVYFITNPDSDLEEATLLETTETALPCEAMETVASRDKVTIDLAPWKYSLFDQYGTYEVRLYLINDLEGESDEEIVLGEHTEAQLEKGYVTTRFKIYEAGTVTQVFRTFISKPLLNFLVFIASVLPGYNLGFAIIILTVVVKLILFFPTQQALEGQKKMQAVQPELDKIRKKFKEDPQRMQKETMAVWKKHGVNPFQSCLPMLIQFPVLIGLFFVIRDGSVLELSQHLLYGPYQNLNWTFGTDFLGLDLKVPNLYIIPPALVVMQFLQMKLSFAHAKKKQGPEDKKKGEKKGEMSQAEMQQKVMLYGLPFMIGFFALKFPAAVSLYWGISTLFAIGQQLVVNRRSS